MEPLRDTRATLVDLLERVLDRGLLLDADLIIHVAGVPLLGVKLRAALAGMETMLKYGMWQDWDAAQRAVACDGQCQHESPVHSPSMGDHPLRSLEGEAIACESFSSVGSRLPGRPDGIGTPGDDHSFTE